MYELMIPIGIDLFFISQEGGGPGYDQVKCSLWKNPGTSGFLIYPKATMQEERLMTMLCNYKDQYIFAIGGAGKNSVERYNIANNIWEYAAGMHEIRIKHGVCVLQQFAYVFGGWNS